MEESTLPDTSVHHSTLYMVRGAVFIDLRASELALSRTELLFIDRCSTQYLYAIGYLKECRAAS